MPAITEESKNSKTLTNESLNADITWDEATMTWNEVERPWDAPGKPITKESKNSKSLTNDTENV